MSTDVTGGRVIDRNLTADHRVVARMGWWAVVEQWVLHMRTYRTSLLVTGIGSPFIYLLGMGAGLGVLVDEGKGIDGVSYLTFLAPALVMATAMQVAAQENTFGVFGGFRWSNLFTAMRLSPISPGQMALGFQAAALVRVAPMILFYMVALWVFRIGDPLGVVWLFPIGLLLAVAVGFGVMSWVSTQKDDRGQLSFIDRFVMVPLTLFSGTYYPLAVLPGYLQWIGWISPLWHAAELGRMSLYGHAVPPWLVVVHVGYLAAIAVVCGWLSMRHFRARLDQ